ncbi:MAG TPA: sugar phosphate nucleotidyltransferase [Bacteroidia bacterium]|jgi:glucose-1-phosphate thymidylyltransferase|nr:sugar phosphate nucleotidyltransferase [Bacteroidia bacterium]
MKLIIPMAGAGKRMRPHTLTVPKPLIPVAGKPMVQHLVEDICAMSKEKIEEIGFVIGHFGKEAEKNLLSIAEQMGAKGRIYYQEEALGTAHAVLCASDMLSGKIIVAFSDTLFRGQVTIDDKEEGIIWVQKVADPKAFGVVKLDKNNHITDFVEKPQEFVSDLAIIGIYYFNDGAYLKKEMQYLLDNNLKEKGEYQITNALENMKKKGTKFSVAQVSEWLDCGNKEATLFTNKRMLETKPQKKVPASVKVENSTVVQPCYLHEDVIIKDSVVGPYVAIGMGTVIENSTITDSIVQNNCNIKNAKISGSMLGNNVQFSDGSGNVNLGDYSQFKG